MSFCTSCGAKISENQKFCPNCGQKVEENKPIKGESPSFPVTKKKKSRVIIVLAIVIIAAVLSFFITTVAVAYKRQQDLSKIPPELKNAYAEEYFMTKAEKEKLNAERAKRDAETQRQNAEREWQNAESARIAGQLKNNPGKYITGYNCVVTVIEKKLFHAITNVDNCNFENRSSFWIKGINGYAFIEDKSGNTIKTAFYADCTLEPQGSKSCVTKSNQVKNGKRVIKVEIANVGYSSNGVW